ncbi:MAG TPA: LuxR C-terminal-related transcriptional regulator [Brevundimonas sp.]|nr:LuxR C-terminal-related transcriptional regulator [Brevundimonas sp.]
MLDERIVLAVEKWFHLSPAPIMIINVATFEILAANRAAELMTHDTVFALSGPGRLMFADPHIDEDFRTQLREIEAEPAVICLRRGDDFLAIRVETAFRDDTAEAVRLTFQGELSGRRVDAGRTLWASLDKAFDLTPAEERVARLLAEGESVSAIAAAVGVTLDTVRSHAQHIYLKVGVSNREQLTARLAQLRFVASPPLQEPDARQARA